MGRNEKKPYSSTIEAQFIHVHSTSSCSLQPSVCFKRLKGGRRWFKATESNAINCPERSVYGSFHRMDRGTYLCPALLCHWGWNQNGDSTRNCTNRFESTPIDCFSWYVFSSLQVFQFMMIAFPLVPMNPVYAWNSSKVH